MEPIKNKNVLISGASMAGLSAAHILNKYGYKVALVEMAAQPRVNGAAVDIKGESIAIAKRMGIYNQLKANSLKVDLIEFRNANDVTEGLMDLRYLGETSADDEIEIERDKFVQILLDELKDDVEFIFNDSITALHETEDAVQVTFKSGLERSFHLLLGCDGIHSGVRKLWFGPEVHYAHFLGAYSSITILNKLLLPQGTMQMFNVPGKAVMLNAYNNKTDVIFCFVSDSEIPYNYRDINQQKEIIASQFAGVSWKTPELLEEVLQSEKFYFDKFCQIKMPSWTKGRVALVGDAAYCASPAAGMGASLAMQGAATVADALQKHNGNYELAFQEYNKTLRPFIEEVQTMARLNIQDNFIPRTEEAILKRNTEGF